MKVYTVSDINALSPCKPATHWVAEDWSGTIQDILVLSNVSDVDKIWVVCKLLSKVGRLCFAYWCAQQARNYAAAANAGAAAAAAAHYAAHAELVAAANADAAAADANAAAVAAASAANAAAANSGAERAAQVKFLKENMHA